MTVLFPFPHHWALITKILVGWNIAIWSYLVMIVWLMINATPHKVKALAEREDNSAITVLVIMSLAAALSIAAIVVELVSVKQVTGILRLAHYLFTATTVLGAWLLVPVIYTFHYAHLFYRSPIHARALKFPDGEISPDYWDFLYFAFNIAIAVQTSDISIASRSIRKTVLAQSILGFIFNVAIIGISINITASMLG